MLLKCFVPTPSSSFGVYNLDEMPAVILCKLQAGLNRIQRRVRLHSEHEGISSGSKFLLLPGLSGICFEDPRIHISPPIKKVVSLFFSIPSLSTKNQQVAVQSLEFRVGWKE